MTTNRFHTEARDTTHAVLDTDGREVVSYEARLNGETKARDLAASLNLELGDVIRDSYGNPAVVVRITNPGTRFVSVSIMQTVGSDRGHVTHASHPAALVTDAASVEWARDIVRTEARRQGLKWNASGIVR